jgi:hypothetical protein
MKSGSGKPWSDPDFVLLSAYTLYMQHRQNKERLKVKLSTGFTASPGHVSETMLLAEAANIGGRPVTVSSYSLQIPDNKVLQFPYLGQHVPLPHELLPGKSCTMAIPIQKVARALLEHGHSEVNLILQFSAQSGEKFSAKPYKFNAQAWAK